MQEGSSAIVVLPPRLKDSPGWFALSQKKRDAIFEHTTRIQQSRQLQMLGEFGELMELYQVEKLLEGEEMKMSAYMRALYSDRSRRTAERKHLAFREFVATIPKKHLDRLTAVSVESLARFDRIATAAIGDIQRVVRELAADGTAISGDTDKYLEAMDTKLLENRQAKRKGKPLKQDEAFAAKMATNAVLHYMRSCGLATSAEKRRWLLRVIGWVMEAQAVHGTLRCGRIPIPDGLLIRRGRPRKKRPEKE